MRLNICWNVSFCILCQPIAPRSSGAFRAECYRYRTRATRLTDSSYRIGCRDGHALGERRVHGLAVPSQPRCPDVVDGDDLQLLHVDLCRRLLLHPSSHPAIHHRGDGTRAARGLGQLTLATHHTSRHSAAAMIYDTGANGVLFKSFLHHSASQNKQECVLRPAISQGFASARSARVRACARSAATHYRNRARSSMLTIWVSTTPLSTEMWRVPSPPIHSPCSLGMFSPQAQEQQRAQGEGVRQQACHDGIELSAH
jgi:hypothetical protein